MDKLFEVINFFKKRPAVLVFLITFLIYSPILLNQYVEDDNIIFGVNTFYHSGKNILQVFGKGYASNFQEIAFNSKSQVSLGTGKESYRPISNVTYFLDYYLFRAQPYGSHLINILIHSVNAVLVYRIVCLIFSSSSLGIFAGLLFSLHPIQSEAVAIMGFRADILSTMFVLFSFYFWIKFKQGNGIRLKYYCGSLIMCLLALFSKESAFMLPFLIILSDAMLFTVPLGFIQSLKQKIVWHLGFILIFVLFIYICFFVFPNANASRTYYSFIDHFLLIGHIWFSYLVNVVMPWTVKAIPTQYHPPIPQLLSVDVLEAGIGIIVFVICLGVLLRENRKCAFFLFWYILFYAPISDVILIVNPMALRYMYLPSIGLLIVMVFYLDKIFTSNFLKNRLQSFKKIFYVAIILICVARTSFLNSDWKSNFNVGKAWVKDFPADYQGYDIVGMGYFDKGDIKMAKQYFEKSIQLGGRLPGEYKRLVECDLMLGQTDLAESLLKQAIIDYPSYYILYFYLGEIYSSHNSYQQARLMLEKSLSLNPSEPLEYVYLMNVYLKSHNYVSAKRLLNKAVFYLKQGNILVLRYMMIKSM